jgi:CBS-domain-containing membrane protein
MRRPRWRGRTRRTLATERLGGLRAADVMMPRPYLAPGWWTVQALVERLLGPDGPRYRVFPVVDLDGRLVGRLHLAEIAAIDPHARLTTTVAEVARPVPAELVVDHDMPLERVLRRPHCPGRDLVVEHDGRVVGLIAVSDLQRAAELEALRSDAAGHRVPWNGSIGWE